MEEVDSLILGRLKQIGCELSDDVKSVKNLSPADLVEGVVRCLRLIDPETPCRTLKLPENVAMRFRFATSLAETVAAHGYKGNIGYQMILYGSEADTRRLLMFLIEKLPKEGVTSLSLTSTAISGLEHAKRIASERLQKELRAPPAPWFSKVHQSQFLNLFWRQPYIDGDATFQSDVININNDLAATQRAFRVVPSSVVVLNASLFTSDTNAGNVNVGNDDASLLLEVQQLASAAVHSSESSVVARGRRKPPVPPKPVGSAKTEVEHKLAKADQVADDTLAQQRERQELLKHQIDSTELELDQKNAELSRLQEKLHETRNAARKIEELLITKKAGMDQLKLAVELSPNMEEHLKQLRDYIGKSESRLEKLGAKRDELCAPLHQAIAEIKQSQSQKPESERLLDDIAILERKASETLSEMQAKKGHLQTLQREYDRMEKVINRAYYTKRILEIVANVNKQKQEIARVISEIRDAQKDVNMLSGKLDRSFTATDELLYKDATRDELIKRAYKCFVSLHECCDNIISHIENSGHVEREMRDLEDQIDTESNRSFDATLDTLVNDYCEMKLANEALFSKLKEAGIDV